MAAANTDKWRKKKSNFSTTLSSSIDNAVTTIPLSSVTGLPTDTGIGLTIDRVDANGVSTPSAVERVLGTISGSSLINGVRANDGTTAAAHDSGAVVEDIWDADTWNDAIDSFLAEHSQAGAHTTDSIAEKTAGVGVTVDSVLLKDGGVTLNTSGDLKLGSSSKGINDSNGNEVLEFGQTASAVNHVKITNAATGNPAIIEVMGGDTNTDLHIKRKGTGVVKIDTELIIQVLEGATDWSVADGKAYFTIGKKLAGLNLVTVHAEAITAGTTGTSDIQLHNVTSALDILSTKLTIDSGETGSDTAATAAVIDAAQDDMTENDVIRVDIDAIATTAPKGLVLRLGFALP